MLNKAPSVVDKENFNIHSYRDDFPILKTTNRGKPLIYLDSGASSQKPTCVIHAMNHFYQNDYANIHRGIYELSERASVQYENARQTVKDWIGANSLEEIIFVKGTTDAINLVAQSYGATLKAGDEIILSEMEHHANIVPWVFLKEKLGIELKIISVCDEGKLDQAHYQSLFTKRTKLVAITHVSNVLGTINPVKEMIAIAHEHQVPVLIDGAQAVPHFTINVSDLDCDFYVFSAHKMYGPTGTGVLYGKKEYLEKMSPYQGGGDMILSVDFNQVQYAPLPNKFEAGTPNILGVIGLAEAIQYLNKIGDQTIIAHEQKLLSSLQEKLTDIKGLKIFGTADAKVGVVSFTIEEIHPHDIGTILDHEGIAIRAGHHCAMPLMKRYNVPAMARVSLGLYNNEADIDALIKGLYLVKKVFN